MSSWDFEEKRLTLRCRCPAAARGLTRKGRVQSSGRPSETETSFGRVVRVPLALDILLALAVGSLSVNRPELKRSLVGKPRPLPRAT